MRVERPICWITRLAVKGVVGFILLTNSHTCGAMEITTPSPVYSYFEGMRGRLPLWTAATTDDPTTVWINPASLGTGKSMGSAYLHTFSDSSFAGDDAFSLSFGAFAFGAEFFDLYDDSGRYSVNRYTVALGGRLARGIYLGTSYSWHSSDIADIDAGYSWSLGTLLRPHRMFSLGLVARDLNSPVYLDTKFKPIFETSLGFRPIGERLTLYATYTARAKKLESEVVGDQPRSFVAYGAELEPLPGVVVRAGADEDHNVSASIALRIATGSSGSVFTFDKGEHQDEDVTYGTMVLTAGRFWYDSVLMQRKEYLEIDLSGNIGETRPRFSVFGGGPRYTLKELLDRIEYAKRSPQVGAILLRCGESSANFAIYDELRQALIDFRDSGKKVIAYVENPGNGVYYLASASDYIVMTPNGYIGLVGLKSEMLFLRGTLEKLGIKAEYARVGKYKSAVEPLTEDQYTEPSKEALDAYLDDLYDKMVGDIASGRGLTDTEVRDLIDHGPYIPSDAVAAGLADTLAYWDEIPGIVGKIATKNMSKLSYGEFSRREPPQPRWDEPPVIGIVYGVGGITHGSNRRDMLIGEIMGSETTCAAIRAMREDGSVKAVVFRVDSPGGVMTASDKIRREIELTTKKKPVIVSMGGVAASGGYHISCDGTMILADEGTVTGSIGVLNLWLHTRGFYEKIGANKDISLRGQRADFMPTWREVTQEELEMVQYYVDKYYDKFVADVSKGRAMSVSEVHEVAQGRIWSGRTAERIGLIDRIGGLSTAIDMAKKEAGIPRGDDVKFKILPKPGGLFEAIASSMATKVIGEVRLPSQLMDIAADASYLEAFDDPFLYLMPYRIGPE